jgi:3'-phosphoadenosine 5'-phosphosulfate sulfotransferase (PAPS reductase)/FAD synthetase
VSGATCAVCGTVAPVCCYDGFREGEHVLPVCPDCCEHDPVAQVARLATLPAPLGPAPVTPKATPQRKPRRAKRRLPVASAAQAADLGDVPDLASYDFIVVSISGGKDSQVMLWHVVRLLAEHGLLDRLVVLHCDLGESEWEGTGELAREHARLAGARFILTSRIGGTAKKDSSVYRKGETYGSILDYAERRGSWPAPGPRWCTSEFKRGPASTVYTALAREWRQAGGSGRPCRILDCQGLRAAESPGRAKLGALTVRKSNGAQHVDTWLPIHRLSEAQVWADIRTSGWVHHYAYDLGMPRLSCAFCIFASRDVLLLAGEHNRDLLDRHVAVEERIGHTFKAKLALGDVRDALDQGERANPDKLTFAQGL